MKSLLRLILPLLLFPFAAIAQFDSTKATYNEAYDSLQAMLAGRSPQSFKKAVFITENAFTANSMYYEKFDDHIRQLATLVMSG